MVRELAHLYQKYQGDLDEIVPFMWMHIAGAMERAERMKKQPAAGAPNIWTPGQLARLWVLVRANQIDNPNLTVRAFCHKLAKRRHRKFESVGLEDHPVLTQGYEVWAEEPRSIKGEEVVRFITNGELLRRRFADAERYLKENPQARENLEEEARWLAELWSRGKRETRRRKPSRSLVRTK